MVFLSSLLDASSSTLSSHCVQSCFFNPFASTYLSKDLQNSSIFFRDDFCPPTCAHPVLYPTAPCPSPPPFSNSCVRCKKKSVTPTPKKDTTTTYQANLLRNSLYTKRDVDAFCEMCIWARVIRACLFFFPPIQNDSMSVLLIWRVQCRKKKKHTHTQNNWPTFSFFFKETINRSERKHTNMQLHVQSILLIFFFTLNKLQNESKYLTYSPAHFLVHE